RNRRKTTRQTLHTEQLEPKAMFSVSPVEPVVALDVGPVNQADYSCTSAGTCSDSIWTNGGASTLRIGGNSGPGGSTFMTGEDGRMVIEPVFNVGEDGRMVIEPVFNVCGSANPDWSTDLRSENRFVFEVPKNDNGITLHAPANPHAGPEGFIKLGDIKGEFQLTQRVAGSSDPGGDDIFMPKPNRGVSLHDSVHCLVGDIGKAPFTTGAGGDSIVHPEFMTDVNSLAQANQQPQIANVWTNGNATSMAPRHAAFARMGR
ncbi:MAG: hypothetical protein ACR2NI_03100, partial [Pirellulales bacterium]